MVGRNLRAAVAALGLIGLAAAAPAWAAIPRADEEPVANLQGVILSELATVTGDKQAVMAAITRVTQGVELDVIVEAVCPLPRADMSDIFGDDAAAIAQAHGTMARTEVREGIAETCDIARVALNSYGATGANRGRPGRPGNSPPPGQIGAPGGGGGSGYSNN